MTIVLLPEDDRGLLRDLVKPARTGRFHCTYCGARCFGRVCRAHRDLIAIEAEATAPHRENTVASDKEGR
jgi:hypothetical protein